MHAAQLLQGLEVVDTFLLAFEHDLDKLVVLQDKSEILAEHPDVFQIGHDWICSLRGVGAIVVRNQIREQLTQRSQRSLVLPADSLANDAQLAVAVNRLSQARQPQPVHDIFRGDELALRDK